MEKEGKKIDSDRFHKIYRIPNIDTHGEYLTIRKFLKKDFDSLPKLDDFINTYMNNYNIWHETDEEREARANREYNREIDGYNFYKKNLLTAIKKILEKDENEILDNVYVKYIHCIYPDVTTRPESFVRLPYYDRNRNIRDRHGSLILKTKDGKSAILIVIHNSYAYNQNSKKNLDIKIILKFAKYEYKPLHPDPDKRIPVIAHNLETNLEGLINYKTCQIENEKFDKIYYKQNKLFSGYLLLVGERNGKLGTTDGYVPPKFDDINGVIRVNHYEVPKDTPCYITTLNGKEGAYFIGKRGHYRYVDNGLHERTFAQTSLKKIIIPNFFDKVTLLDFSPICHPNHSMEEFISNPIFKVVLNGKEGIYLGGKKKFLTPPIFDIDGISNYDLDNQTVEGYIDGIYHIYQNGVLKRIENVDFTISDDTKETLTLFLNKVRKRNR